MTGGFTPGLTCRWNHCRYRRCRRHRDATKLLKGNDNDNETMTLSSFRVAFVALE